MGQIASWNGFTFEVSPGVVRSFTGLTIEGGSVTEDKVSNKYAYVKRKNSSPTAVNLEIYLNAYLGCNVRDEAMAFIKAATEGNKNYFYLNGKKLVTCQLMLVSAKVTELEMTPSGEWTSCKIALSMKQCEKYSGSSSSSSSSTSSSNSKKKTQTKKTSVKQQNTTTKKTTEKTQTTSSDVKTAAAAAIDRISENVANVKSQDIAKAAAVVLNPVSAIAAAGKAIASGVSKVGQVISTAKKTTSTSKSTKTYIPASKRTSAINSRITTK